MTSPLIWQAPDNPNLISVEGHCAIRGGDLDEVLHTVLAASVMRGLGRKTFQVFIYQAQDRPKASFRIGVCSANTVVANTGGLGEAGCGVGMDNFGNVYIDGKQQLASTSQRRLVKFLHGSADVRVTVDLYEEKVFFEQDGELLASASGVRGPLVPAVALSYPKQKALIQARFPDQVFVEAGKVLVVRQASAKAPRPSNDIVQDVRASDAIPAIHCKAASAQQSDQQADQQAGQEAAMSMSSAAKAHWWRRVLLCATTGPDC